MVKGIIEKGTELGQKLQNLFDFLICVKSLKATSILNKEVTRKGPKMINSSKCFAHN